mmetsp:Transcript_47201/g.110361  ORF Transcript_47201/g.110361 Transcript_47201/m.110361 type:complete len:210 (-) Transcript_47201:659-1288(-)
MPILLFQQGAQLVESASFSWNLCHHTKAKWLTILQHIESNHWQSPSIQWKFAYPAQRSSIRGLVESHKRPTQSVSMTLSTRNFIMPISDELTPQLKDAWGVALLLDGQRVGLEMTRIRDEKELCNRARLYADGDKATALPHESSYVRRFRKFGRVSTKPVLHIRPEVHTPLQCRIECHGEGISTCAHDTVLQQPPGVIAFHHPSAPIIS